MNRQVLELSKDNETEHEAEDRDHQSAHEKRVAVHAAKRDRGKIGNDQIRFAAAGRGRSRRGRLRRGLRGLGRRWRGRRAQQRRHHHDWCGDAHQELLYCQTHLPSHKRLDYSRRLGGSATPPVRKMRMPSSTETSGNTARCRSQTMTSPRYRLFVGTYTASISSGPLPRLTVNSFVKKPIEYTPGTRSTSTTRLKPDSLSGENAAIN